jgi:hypothetical protein
MLLFFSVARSQEIGQWERAETAPSEAIKPVKTANNATPTLSMNLPPMSSAFDTAMLLAAA